jgi:carbon storage regulator
MIAGVVAQTPVSLRKQQRDVNYTDEGRARPSELWEMLVLSRKKNESIVVDDLIVITVVEIRGDKVRLGIEAPREVPIHRSEVRDAMAAQAEQTPAVKASLKENAATE